MPDAENKKLSERTPSAEKSDRPNRSSPFVRWRSLREPKSQRSPVNDGRNQNSRGSTTADDLSVTYRGEPESEAANTSGSDPTKVAGISAPGPASKLGVTQKGADRKDGVVEDDKLSHTQAKPQSSASALPSSSRSLFFNKKITAAEESGPAGRAGGGTAIATTIDKNPVTKPLPASATLAEAGGIEPEISRGAHGRRSLRILFSRPASIKQKTVAKQQQQHHEQFPQTLLTIDTATANVSSDSAAASPSSRSEHSFSPPISSEKQSKLAAYKRSSANKQGSARDAKGSSNRESLPPTATAADSSGGSQAVKLRNSGAATAAAVPQPPHKGSPRDGASQRPGSVNENHLHTLRPSLRMSPEVCAGAAASDGWHSGVSLSSPSSSESSIANQHDQQQQQQQQQQPGAARAGGSGQAANQLGANADAVLKQPRDEPAAGKLHLMQPGATAKVTEAVIETSAASGCTELPPPGADDESTAAIAETSKVVDAGSVLKFLSEHSKVLSSLAPAAARAEHLAAEADVLQLTEEVKLLKTGLIHCEAVLREEEAARHRLQQELLERDSLIKTLQKQLSLCRCEGENSHSLRNGWTDVLPDSERSSKDLLMDAASDKADGGYTVISFRVKQAYIISEVHKRARTRKDEVLTKLLRDRGCPDLVFSE